MKAIGIDLCGSLATVWDGVADTELATEAWFPTVSMRIMDSEPILAGPRYAGHRRGAGLEWPPESQIPYCFDRSFGYPKLTIARVWQEMLALGSNSKGWDDYKPGLRTIAWQPHPNEPPVTVSAEELIVETALSLLPEGESTMQVCLVVPDDLGEGAQQALIERWNESSVHKLHLLPRPVAIAMSWCKNHNASEFELQNFETGDCGHITVLSMDMDRWEAVPIGIRRINDNGKLRLIPIRDHTLHNSEVAVDGISLLAAYALSTGLCDVSKIWNNLTCGDLIASIERNARIGALNCGVSELELNFRRIKQLTKNWINDSENSDTITSYAGIRSAIRNSIEQKKQDLPESFRDRILGTACNGIFSILPIQGKSLDETLDDQSQKVATTGRMSSRKLSAIGAGLVAKQLASNSRTYCDRIAPIEIYANTLNQHLDPELSLEPLIESCDVEAGKAYENKKPISGFSIVAGSDKLELTLRRKYSDRILNRQVLAELKETTTGNEKVILNVKAAPGQGYATVSVVSERAGLFETKLNWRTMVDCEAPSDPVYSWPPGMARVICDKRLARESFIQFEKVIEYLATGGSPTRTSTYGINSLRERLNKWPKYDGFRNYSLRLPEGTPKEFLYCGILSSTNTIEEFPNSALLNKFSKLLGIEIARDKHRIELMRLAAWMYEACPAEAIKRVRKTLSRFTPNDAELMLIGNVFKQVDDFKAFYRNWLSLINTSSSNNNWLRAFRNLIRFRTSALATDSLDQEQMGQISNHIYGVMRREFDSGNLGQIYNNCLYIAPHLLKRRKFDPDFLDPSSRDGQKWIILFEEAKEYGSTNQWSSAEASLAFFKKKGSKADLERLWKSEE